VGRISGRCRLDQPLAAPRGSPGAHQPGRRRPETGRAAHLALLRDLRYGGRPHAAPDNFQEDPRPVLAHRTSPTNLGLYLLSAVSARDFGWAGTLQTVERLEATLATMNSLQRFRGHFYNWYDTRDLRPWTRATSPPWTAAIWRRICSPWRMPVGNGSTLPGHVASRLPYSRCPDSRARALRELPADQRTQVITHRQVEDALDVLASALGSGALASGELAEQLAHSATHAATLVDIARVLAGELSGDAGADILFWAEAAQGSIESWRRDSRRRTRKPAA